MMQDAVPFVPDEFDPPTLHAVGSLRLEPLGPVHNERDHAAWTSSMDHIRGSPGWNWEGSWPRPMGLAENLADLERHAGDFENRSGFTYTVLDADDDVGGCGYIYPGSAGMHDAVVR